MAVGRKGSKIQSKVQALIYGKTFTGKSTFASQFAYMKRADGKPFRVLFLDAESGGLDDLMEELESNDVDLGNLYIIYTQSLAEVREFIKTAKDKQDFYEYDEDGNETDIVVLDADGEPFRPDAIVIDGASVLNMTTKHGLVELSKKRAKVKADRAGLIGEEKFVQIENSFLELKDYQKVNFKGQDLILDLTACGLHYIVTAREVDEKETIKVNVDGKEKEVTVSTGRKIPEGFKEMDYNTKTVIRFIREEDTYEEVKAIVLKDRTKVHLPGEVLNDPTLLDWQVVIDKTANNANFIVNNNLSQAINTEYEMAKKEVMDAKDLEEESNVKNDISELMKKIADTIKTLSPVKKKETKQALMNKGLPTEIKTVTDEDVLNQIYEVVSNM